MRKSIPLVLLLAACGSKESKPAASDKATGPTPGSAAPADAAPAAAAPTLPAELAAIEPKAKLVAGPFAWPKGGSSAVVADEDTALVWKLGTATGSIHLPREAARAITRDVTKDGQDELVIFAKPPAKPLEWFEDQTLTWIIGIGPTKNPARMWLAETQALGAHDEASLDSELAATTLGPTTSSPVKLVARLPIATLDELKALVGAKGLKLCNRQGEKKKCTTVAQKSIDKKHATEIVNRGGVISTFSPDELADSPAEALQPPACEADEKDAKKIVCSASVGGPAGGEWVFEKLDSGVRLAEVWSWAEDS